MRWPFSLLFRGDRDAPAAADAGAPDPGAPDTAVDPARAAAVPSRPAAWRSLPPVQRSIGDAPLTAPAVAFGRELAGLRPPDPILRPLVHDLAADGPAGLVSGIVTPLAGRVAPFATPADHAALPTPRGVQRRARTVSAAPLPSPEGASRPADAPRPADASAAALSALSPPRVLLVVAPSATAPALGATRVGASTAPEAARALAPTSGAVAPTSGAAAPMPAGSPVQRSAASTTPPTAPSPVAPPVAPSTGPGTVPDGAPDAAPDAAGPTPGWGAPAARPAQARSLGESRRLGLGAPLAGRPSVQCAVAGPDLPVARAGRTTARPTSPIAALPPPRRAAAAEATLPVLRVTSQGRRPATPPEPGATRSGDGAAGTPPAAPADAGADGGVAGPETPSVQRSGERPLVGDVNRHAPTSSRDGPDGEPAGSELGEGLPLAIGTRIDGARLAHGGAAAPAPTGPLSAGPGGAAPPSGPTAAPSQPTAAPAAPAARSVPLVIGRSLRGAAPLRLGADAPTAAPPARAGRTAAPAGFEPGSGHAASAFPALQAPGTPGPGSAASGWAVAQRSSVEDGGSRPTSGAPAWMPSLPVARAAATPGPSGPAAGRSSETVAVSRLTDGGGSAPPPPPGVRGWSAGGGFSALSASDAVVVQRAVEIEELATQVDAAPAPGAAEGAAGGAGAGGAGQDYEEIADRVYDRIRSQLATELLLDRERMGLLIDG